MRASAGDVWDYLDDRFGVDPADAEPLVLIERSGDYWLASPHPVEGDVETRGFRFVRVQQIGLKPTTYALQFLGDRIMKNRVSLSRQQLQALLDGEMVEADADSEGYVALVYEGRVVGCGMYRNGTVSTRIPKGRAQHLKHFL